MQTDIANNVEKMLNNLVKKYNHILKGSTYIDRYTDNKTGTDKIRIIIEGKNLVVLRINVDTDLMTDIMSKGSEVVIPERIIDGINENNDLDTLAGLSVSLMRGDDSADVVAEDIRYLEEIKSGLTKDIGN